MKEPYAVSSLDDVRNRKLPERRWLVPGAITHPSIGMTYARRGSGKTFFALKLALDVAFGCKWAKPFGACPPRNVLYVDGEMALPDIYGRIQQMLPEYPGTGAFHILNGEQIALEQGDNVNLSLHACRSRLEHTLVDIEKRTKLPVEFMVLDN